jgi:hypothetical protein
MEKVKKATIRTVWSFLFICFTLVYIMFLPLICFGEGWRRLNITEKLFTKHGWKQWWGGL